MPPGDAGPDRGSPAVPAAPGQERAADPVEPSPSPSALITVEEAAGEQVLADMSSSSAPRAAGAFTPMRTMVVLVVVIAVAASGAGRAAARVSG